MSEIKSTSKIPIGISACLLGENVRYDGGHKKDAYITATFTKYFLLIPFCPEVAIGLGVPRQPIELAQTEKGIRVRGVIDSSLDVTDDLRKYTDEQRDGHANLFGFILKANSPSCGIEGVKVLTGNTYQQNGVGIFAQRLMKNFPLLPVEDERRLEREDIRENFFQCVFALNHWHSLNKTAITVDRLINFHNQHDQILRRRNLKVSRDLGNLAAKADKADINQIAGHYIARFMNALRQLA